MPEIIRGYKILDTDMCAIYEKGIQYELGVTYEVHITYEVQGNVVLCTNGFHFCKELEQLNSYYDIINNRIFEVEASGVIVASADKKYYVAEKIKFVKELSKEEIAAYFEKHQKELVKSEWYVRQALAWFGYQLDILSHDEEWQVRYAVAEQGYGLDVLINDEHYLVRKVAKSILEGSNTCQTESKVL